jgi:hypothetical protein
MEGADGVIVSGKTERAFAASSSARHAMAEGIANSRSAMVNRALTPPA